MKQLCILQFTYSSSLTLSDDYDKYYGTTGGNNEVIAVDSNGVLVQVELLYKYIILYSIFDVCGDINTYLNKLLNAGIRVLITEKNGNISSNHFRNAPIESSQLIYDNPFNFHMPGDGITNKWGTINIYKNNEIEATIGPRVSWTHINLIDCIELTKFIPTIQINKDNMHFVGADKMPRFRAFLLCLKCMPKLPQPIKWIILNLWYFCS